MTDNKKEIKASNIRINVSEPSDLMYWCNYFNCTSNQLEDAINKVGSNSEELNKYFKLEANKPNMNPADNNKPLKPILLVDDDEVDVMTLTRAFKHLKVNNKIKRASNGLEALEYLMKTKDDLPCLILLDLNMPKMNGHELLQKLKENKELCSVPVVILSTSNEPSDIDLSYKLGAAGYIQKPVDYSQYQENIQSLSDYWSLSRKP